MGEKSTNNCFVYLSGWEVSGKQVGRSEKFLRSFPAHLSRKLWAKTTIQRRKSLIINEKVRSAVRSRKYRENGCIFCQSFFSSRH